jgi:hypothetical protein
VGRVFNPVCGTKCRTGATTTRKCEQISGMAEAKSEVPDPATNGHFNSCIHQATGMISVQAHCDLSEALAKLRMRAAGMGESLEAVAVGVIDGAIRFDE